MTKHLLRTTVLTFIFSLFITGSALFGQDTISGTMSFAGAGAPPMPGVKIMMLNSQNAIVDSAVTDANGFYSIIADTSLPTGTYKLKASISAPWQGVTNTDVYHITMHSLFGNVLQTQLDHEAADVNDDGLVTINDAVLVLHRILGVSNSFPSGDWQYSQFKPITLNANANKDTSGSDGEPEENDSQAKQSGNGEPVPDPGDTKKPGKVDLMVNREVNCEGSNEYLLPVKAYEKIEFGALDLHLGFPQELISSIEIIPCQSGVNYSVDHQNGKIHITCSALEKQLQMANITTPSLQTNSLNQIAKQLIQNNKVTINEGENLCYIKVAFSENFVEGQSISFNIDQADAISAQLERFETEKKLIFEIPTLINSAKEKFKVSSSYPNPSNSVTSIDVYSPETGSVTLELYDLSGNKIFSEAQVYDAGFHTLKIDISEYDGSLFFASVIFSGENSTESKTVKLMKF